MRFRRFFVFLWSAVAAGSLCQADVVTLRSGGRLEGQIVASKEDENGHRTKMVMVLKSGARIMLLDSDVAKVETVSDDEIEYQRRLKSLPNTASAHLELAQWCEQNRLADQRRFHLQQVLEIDPNHEQVRRMLGYARHGNRWMRQEDFMASQGYERYDGRWLLPQQIEILKHEKELDLGQKEFRRDLRMWRDWLGGRRHSEAIRNFTELKNPLAAAGLIDLMAKEKDADVRAMYLEALGRMGMAGINELINTALNDSDEDLRIRAVELLNTDQRRTYAVQALIPYLQSNDNVYVNQAAQALGELGHASATWPLMQAVVTDHTRIVKPRNSMNTAFGNGGIGLSAGQKPRKIVETRENSQVLAALSKITGQNFGYEKTAWFDWYIQAHTPSSHDIARDP